MTTVANKRKLGLTAKQARFVDEYMVDLNATQAAIRSGYSPKTAGDIGRQLLRKTPVAIAIAERQRAVSERTGVTVERVISELAKIGFSDIRNVVNWGDAVGVKDPETGEVLITNGVALIPASDLNEDAAACIAEISQTREGVMKVKLHDKRAALVDLGKHLGMFKDTVELTGKDGGPIQTEGKMDLTALNAGERAALRSIVEKAAKKGE